MGIIGKETISSEDIDLVEFVPTPRKTVRKEHYVNNKQLLEEFKKYRVACDIAGEKVRLPEAIGKAILDIAQRNIYKRNFIGYTEDWKSEMISEAIEICCRYVHNFDPEKSNNPFAYITQLVNNAYKACIKTERRQLYYKNKAIIEMNGVADEDFNSDEVDAAEYDSTIVMENAMRYVESYERALLEKEPSKPKKDEFNLDDIFEE